MDIQRISIWSGLAVLLYLMLLAWNEDYPDNVAEKLSAIQSSGSIDNSYSSLPIEAEADFPVTQSVAVNPNLAAVPQGQLITVTTDNFELSIDPNGGDILQLGLKKFPASMETPNVPYPLMMKSDSHNFIVQSGLTGLDSGKQRPNYASTQTAYVMANDQDSLTVSLSYISADNIEVIKEFTFYKDNYLIDINYHLANKGNQQWQSRFFGLLKRDDVLPPLQNSSAFGVQPYLGGAVTTPATPYKKLEFEDIAETPIKDLNLTGGWIAVIQHYFVTAWVPPKQQEVNYQAKKSGSNYIYGYTGPLTQLAPGQSTSLTTQLYAGPKDQYRLANIAEHLDLTIDYGWLWFIAQILFALLIFINSGVLHMGGEIYDIGFGASNWGWSIIILTIFIKTLFFKLSQKSYESTANMRRVQPQLTSLRERFGEDKQKMSQAMMDLYKKEKINPLGGCLPMLIQMPVFIALYWTLIESVELRHAPFLFWLQDLSVKDPFFILPLLMGATMFIQFSLNPPPPDPMQAKVMKLMPIFMTGLFLLFPAGLVLYWVVNNILSIIQQWIITKRIEGNASTA